MIRHRVGKRETRGNTQLARWRVAAVAGWFCLTAGWALADSPNADKKSNSLPFREARTAARTKARVTSGPAALPNNHQQVWREYDLRPFTEKASELKHPERLAVDWVLRETGTETWFGEPLGVLSATKDTLRVYHTPAVHEVVAEVVDKLVAMPDEKYVIGLQLVTVGSPNWRARAIGWLQPVTVQSPGVEAWLVSRENAALLLTELRKRTDYREHQSANLSVLNGQTETISRTQHRIYPRTVRPREGGLPGFDIQNGQIDEGYSLQVSSLMSLDGRSIDAVIHAQIDQVEKFVPVNFDIAGANNSKQPVALQVPQLVSWRLHERFRWPANQVLLLSCGVIATPPTERSGGMFNLNFMGNSNRADGLLFVEWKGAASQVLLTAPATSGLPTNTGGRY